MDLEAGDRFGRCRSIARSRPSFRTVAARPLKMLIVKADGYVLEVRRIVFTVKHGGQTQGLFFHSIFVFPSPIIGPCAG